MKQVVANGALALLEISPGVLGRLHVSDYAHERTDSLDGTLGKTLQVSITRIDTQDENVALSRKALLQHPRERLQVGSWYHGKVVDIKPFGAFVDIGHGIQGLVHISELAKGFVHSVEDIVHIRKQVKVRVLETNPKLKLSMKPEAP